MTDRELLKQALEALEMWCQGPHDSVTRRGANTRSRVAIAALRERLAREEQDGMMQVAEALRHVGLTLVRTAKGFDVMNLGQIEAQGAARQEPTVEDNSQNWRGMDGATAWHLIHRHADGWADVGKMMGEWLAANQQEPARQEQEPAAWMYRVSPGPWELAFNEREMEGAHKRIPLYTAPQREWVGLTDEEIVAVYGNDLNYRDGDYVRFARDIEAKLRRKNSNT